MCMLNRRKALKKAAATGSIVIIAGCHGTSDDDTDDDMGGHGEDTGEDPEIRVRSPEDGETLEGRMTIVVEIVNFDIGTDSDSSLMIDLDGETFEPGEEISVDFDATDPEDGPVLTVDDDDIVQRTYSFDDFGEHTVAVQLIDNDGVALPHTDTVDVVIEEPFGPADAEFDIQYNTDTNTFRTVRTDEGPRLDGDELTIRVDGVDEEDVDVERDIGLNMGEDDQIAIRSDAPEFEQATVELRFASEDTDEPIVLLEQSVADAPQPPETVLHEFKQAPRTAELREERYQDLSSLPSQMIVDFEGPDVDYYAQVINPDGDMAGDQFFPVPGGVDDETETRREQASMEALEQRSSHNFETGEYKLIIRRDGRDGPIVIEETLVLDEREAIITGFEYEPEWQPRADVSYRLNDFEEFRFQIENVGDVIISPDITVTIADQEADMHSFVYDTDIPRGSRKEILPGEELETVVETVTGFDRFDPEDYEIPGEHDVTVEVFADGDLIGRLDDTIELEPPE